MHYVAVTLEVLLPHLSSPLVLDLDIPWMMPVSLFLHEALPEILAKKHVHFRSGQQVGHWFLFRLLGSQALPVLTHTFRGAGISDGERLRVERRTTLWPPYRFYLEQRLSEGAQGDEDTMVVERIYLALPRILLGRSDERRKHFVDVDLRFFPYGRQVSRRHAEIRYQNGGFLIRDLGSTNGTWLNGHRLPAKRAYPLRPGDWVSFGKSLHFEFKEEQEGHD